MKDIASSVRAIISLPILDSFPTSLPTANEMVKLTSDYVNTTITNFVIFCHTHIMMIREGVETNQDKETHRRADPVDNCGPGDECLLRALKGEIRNNCGQCVVHSHKTTTNGHQLTAP